METLHSPKFSYDWFTTQAKLTFERWLLPLAGRKLLALEVGSFEGRSALWLLEHVLTHPGSRLECIDSFTGGSDLVTVDLTDLGQRFNDNVSQYQNKVELTVGDSWDELGVAPSATFDFVFIDGSHETWDVLHDAVEAFRIVRQGGLILFDDYGWGLDRESRPGIAIDAFLQCFASKLEVLEKDYCVVVRKL